MTLNGSPGAESIAANFRGLPRELRDQIYEHYVRVDGGYTYDFRANKLTEADGRPILLDLALTCQQIASEMEGVALKFNTITFSTFFSEETRAAAGMYHAVVTTITNRKATLLNELAPRLLTAEMAREAAASYPQFASILDCWRVQGQNAILRKRSTDCGEAPSIWIDFVHFTLNLISKHPNFVDEANSSISPYYLPYRGGQVLALNDASPRSWSTPCTYDLKPLAIVAQAEPWGPYYEANTKYAYSAASVALRFLHSVPPRTRSAIRNILLLEDRESVANPWCHGRGFIPFCQENRKLRVEHSVSLWENAFPISRDHVSHYMSGDQRILDRGFLDDDRLPADKITKAVGAWIAETLVLRCLGMPQDSYTLVLDGNPTPKHTSEVFRVVQRDVVWQSALDVCYARGLLPEPSWLDRRLRVGYMYEGLPDVIRNFSTDGSLIRCNFEPYPTYNIEDLLEENSGWSLQDWKQGWATHEPREFQTEPPLPPWHILRWQHVIYVSWLSSI